MNKKRRANILAGLLNNWEKAEQVRQRALESSTEAENAQQKLLETSAGQIEKMTSNWQIFSENVIDSSAVKTSLEAINFALESINESMGMASQKGNIIEELGIDTGSKVKFAGYTPLPYVGDKEVDEVERLINIYNSSKFEEAVENREKILSSGSESERKQYLESLEKEQSLLESQNSLIQENVDEQNRNLEVINKLNSQLSTGDITLKQYTDEKNAIKEKNKILENSIETQQRMKAMTLGSLGLMGVGYGELEETIKTFYDNIENKSEEVMTDTRTTAEKYFDDLENFDSETTQTMIENWDNLSKEMQQDIIDVAEQTIRQKKRELESRKNSVLAIQAEIRAMAILKKVQSDDFTKKFSPIVGIPGAKDAVEQYQIDLDKALKNEEMFVETLIQDINETQSELDGLLGKNNDSSSSSSGGDQYEALSELEKQIMEIQHQSKLLDDELKRTDGYEEQISIINQLLSLKDKEIAKMEELAEDQKTEYMQYGEKTEEYEKGIEAYYKTVEAIGKLKNETYDYIETLESLGETQEEINTQSVENMRDNYTGMFDKLRDGYKDDADEFEKSQDKKIRAVEKTIDRLRKKYDEEDFVDEEEEIQDKILALEEERQMLSIDNSLQAQKRKFDINNELEVEEENLSKLRQERERELTIEGLEDKKDSYEEETRVYKEQLEERLDELDRFEKRVLNNLDNYKEDWADAGGNIGDAFKGGLLPALQDINKEIAKTINSFNEITGEDIEVPDTSGSSSGSSRGTKTRYVDPQGNIQNGYIKDGKTTSASGGDIPTGSIVETAGGNYQKTANGSKLRNDIDINDYVRHDGGIVGGQSFKNGGFMDYMSKMSGNEMPIIAERGEAVITESDIGNIAGATQATAQFDSLIQVNNPKIGGNYNGIEDFSKQLATITNDQLAKLGIVNIGRN